MKLFIIMILIFTSHLVAQNLIDGAESVAFHEPTNSYYVSSLLGAAIVKIDSNGTQSFLKNNITSFGNCMKGDTLYVSSGGNVNGIDVTSGALVFNITVPGAVQLDGITHDNDGKLYVVETVSNKIAKIDIQEGSVYWIVESGLEPSTQDVIYDSLHHRVLICAYRVGSSILSMDPETGELTEVCEAVGGFDGITIDEDGFVYLGTHTGNGMVIMYDSTFTIGPITLFEGIPEPAGLDYNRMHHTLAVPSFAGDSVMFLPLAEDYFYPGFEADHTTGHLPLSISFTDLTLMNGTAVSWEWDFDNDGVIDSYDRNPTYVYSDTGAYTVTLTVNGSYDSTVVKEDYIHVFDGESSLLFDKNSRRVKIEPDALLHLQDDFTIEAFIKPLSWPAGLSGATILDKSSVRFYYNGNALGLMGDQSIAANVLLSNGKTVRMTAPDSLIMLNAWNHIAFSLNVSENEAFFYINGAGYPAVIVGSDTLTGELAAHENAPLYLGNNSQYSSWVTGTLDEIRLWKRVLTRSEILENIASPLQGTEQDLAGYWNCNEGSGSILIDNTLNGHDGTIEEAVYGMGVDFSNVTDVEAENKEQDMEFSFDLNQNYPNPFNPTTTIEFQLDEAAEIRLTIFDMLGSEIVKLSEGYFESGAYQIRWNGKNSAGADVGTGAYIYRLNVGDRVLTQKMLLLR